MKVFNKDGVLSFPTVHDFLYSYIPEDNWVKADRDAVPLPWRDEKKPADNVQLELDLDQEEEKEND